MSPNSQQPRSIRTSRRAADPRLKLEDGEKTGTVWIDEHPASSILSARWSALATATDLFTSLLPRTCCRTCRTRPPGQALGGPFVIDPADVVFGGMSRSPLISASGAAIGVICTSNMAACLINGLPGWLLRALAAWPQLFSTSKRAKMQRRKIGRQGR